MKREVGSPQDGDQDVLTDIKGRIGDAAGCGNSGLRIGPQPGCIGAEV